MTKENPCIKCCSYNSDKVCECGELLNYKHYQQGRADERSMIIGELYDYVHKNYQYDELEHYILALQLKERSNG